VPPSFATTVIFPPTKQDGGYEDHRFNYFWAGDKSLGWQVKYYSIPLSTEPTREVEILAVQDYPA
jgi:hypothetical protein